MLAGLRKPTGRAAAVGLPRGGLRALDWLEDRLVLLASLGLLYFLIYEHSQWQPFPGAWPTAMTRVPIPGVYWYTGGWLLFSFGLWAVLRHQPATARSISDLAVRRLALCAVGFALALKATNRLTGVGLLGLESQVPLGGLVAAVLLAACAFALLLCWPPPSLPLTVLLLGGGIAARAATFVAFEENPALADNLVVVRLGLERMAAGATPYGQYAFPDHSSPMAYLPWTLLSYAPAFLLGLDVRWANLVASLALTLALWRVLYLLRLPPSSRNALGLLLAVFFVLPRNLGNDLNSEFPPLNLALVLTFALVALGRWRAAAAAFGVALGAMPVALFCAAPLLAYALRTLPWRHVAGLAALCAVVASAPALAFLAWDAPAFLGAVFGDARDALDSTSRMVYDEPFLLLWHRLPPEWLRLAQVGLFGGSVWLAWTRLRTPRGLVALAAGSYLALVLSSPLIMPHYFALVLYLALLAEAIRTALPIERPTHPDSTPPRADAVPLRATSTPPHSHPWPCPTPTIAVVLPTFNERDNIRALIAAVQAAHADARVLVVDDDSPDGTWQVVAALAVTDPRVGVIRRVGERGLTTAIQRGIDEAGADVVVWMDADGSMPAAAIGALVAAIERGADVAVGSRYVPGGRDARSLALVGSSVLINLLARALLGTGVTDYTSGFVAARRDLLDRLRLRGEHGEYCIDLLTRAARGGREVVEVGYVLEPRRFGTSKTAPSLGGFAANGQRYLSTILRLAFARRPEPDLAREWIAAS